MAFPKPKKGAIFYEDRQVYAALANNPIAEGHCVVVWKRDVKDLHILKRASFEHLMAVVDAVRNAMLKVLRIKKVYLIYMDEANHVHWHLVPRHAKRGVNMLAERPRKLKDTKLAVKLMKQLVPFVMRSIKKV